MPSPVLGAVVALGLVLAAPGSVAAQPAIDHVREGYLRFYAGDSDGAQQHFDALRATGTDNLRGWFGATFVLQSRVSDDDRLGPVFEKNIDALIAHAEARYGRSRQDADALFHLAQAHLLRGTYRFERDKGMWGAARDAAKAKGYADEYVKRHPEHGDAYLALGLYNYYVDIAPNFIKVLRVLLFLPSGNRAEGLKQLERAAREGDLFAPLAQMLLADTYAQLEGRVAEAMPMAEQLVQRFPANFDMRFSLAEMYVHPAVEAYESAAQQYAAVLERATGSSRQQMSARYRATQAMADMRRAQWRIDDAIALLTPAIAGTVETPDWVLPSFLLRRGNYRMLLDDPQATEDPRRVRANPKMTAWHKAADQLLDAAARRARTNEAAVYAALLPGNRLVADDRFDEARAIYERVGAGVPGDWQVRYRLAYLEFARGDYFAAAAALTPIVSAPGAPAWLKAAAMLTLAWTHDIAGRRAEAMRLYKRIVDQFEDEAAATAARLGLIAPHRGPVQARPR
jgi:tetratricopeptide (TPR) repeat protein